VHLSSGYATCIYESHSSCESAGPASTVAEDQCDKHPAGNAHSPAEACAQESEASCWLGPSQPLGHPHCTPQISRLHAAVRPGASEAAIVSDRANVAAAADAVSQCHREIPQIPASGHAASLQHRGHGCRGVHAAQACWKRPGVTTPPAEASQLSEASQIQQSSAAALLTAAALPAAAEQPAPQLRSASAEAPLQLTRRLSCNSTGCETQSPPHPPTASAPDREESGLCSGEDVKGQHTGSENGAECALPLPLPWVQPTQEHSSGAPAECLPDADAGVAPAQLPPQSTASSQRAPLEPLRQ
jgi:hypothetical protein